MKLPIKMFILDNNGYASIRATQRNMFDGLYVGSDPGSGLTMLDRGPIANAYGIRHERAISHQDLPDAIFRTLGGSDPVLCSVKVTQSHVTAPRVQAMKTPDGGMISKPLEDMWPFLDREEFASHMIVPIIDELGEHHD
jgi:acetolactate synthase-1/2/3 large subunit